MSEVQREKAEETLCCCVLVWRDGRPISEVPCDSPTGSPDNPFCPDCTDRHPGDQAAEIVTVTQRLRTRSNP